MLMLCYLYFVGFAEAASSAESAAQGGTHVQESCSRAPLP